MRKSFILLSIPVLITGMLLFSSFGGDENSDYPGGSPAGFTGSPGDGKDCVQCHGGSSTVEPGWITSDIPPDGYTPGQTYNITVTVTGSGDKGFQVSPQDPAGQQLGTLIAGTGTHLNGGTKYVNHNSKTSANPATWNFQWTAPVPGVGEVIFYGAFTVNKPVTKTSTLIVQQASAVSLEDKDKLADQVQLALYPNPVHRLLTIRMGTRENFDLQLSILDLSGQPLLIKKIQLQSGIVTNQLDMSSLPSGIYLLKVCDEKRAFSRKIIKE